MRAKKTALLLPIFACLFLPCAHGEISAHEIAVDGIDREYYVYAPQLSEQAVPLVFVLHGGKGNAKKMMRLGFNALADERGAIVVYPQGSVPEDKFKTTLYVEE